MTIEGFRQPPSPLQEESQLFEVVTPDLIPLRHVERSETSLPIHLVSGDSPLRQTSFGMTITTSYPQPVTRNP